MTTPVTVRDRRDLPFFIVRLRALQEIRNNISGPRRARALGLYVLLCQLANEQRHEGQHIRLVTTCKDLARRAAIGTTSLKILSTALGAAGAAEFETRIDSLRGAMPSLIHLHVQDGPWIALTVTSADRLTEQAPTTPLPTLGLLAVLLELCDEQRATLGGLRAETTRNNVARRAGCSTDTLDTWVKTLEAAALLTVTRRRGPDGGNLPNLWQIREPTPADPHGPAHREPPHDEAVTGTGDPAAPAPTRKLALTASRVRPPGATGTPQPENGDTLAENQEWGPGETEISHRPNGKTLPGEEEWPPGESATPVTDPRRLNTRARHLAETPTTEEQAKPPTPTSPGGAGGEESRQDPDVKRLCRELVETLGDTRGPAPARRYAADPVAWHAAAGRILADHPIEKVLEAIAYLPRDQVIGTKVRGMPDLERQIEDLRHRAHAAYVPPREPGQGRLRRARLAGREAKALTDARDSTSRRRW